MQPTDEQRDAIDLFAAGMGLAIEAGAGTGKTTTLVQIGKSTARVGQYVAFNRAIVDEAKRKMPDNVSASTAHSLAMRSVGRQFQHRLGGQRLRSDQLARKIGVHPMVVTYGSQRKVMQPGFLASHAMRAIRVFCQTADPAPTAQHVPYIDGIDVPESDGKRGWANNLLVREQVASLLPRIWSDLCKPDGELPYTHDHYLKLWERSEPVIFADFVLFDEAQDAAPVMLSIVEQQQNAQRVFVGDSQQQIYEWRGAVNALQAVPADARTFLTQSFRFGPAIADMANLVLDRLAAELRLVGTPSIESRIDVLDKPDAILCRTNAEAIMQVLTLQAAGKTAHLVGGAEDVASFARAAKALQQGETVWHPELACFTSWGEVVDYVQNDPQGDELALLVKLVDSFGCDVILRALDNVTPEHLASCIVSTAHKAKGREWRSVMLASDFDVPDDGEPSAGEWRLLYVALTRAREVLDMRLCAPLQMLVEEREAPPLAPLDRIDELSAFFDGEGLR